MGDLVSRTDSAMSINTPIQGTQYPLSLPHLCILTHNSTGPFHPQRASGLMRGLQKLKSFSSIQKEGERGQRWTLTPPPQTSRRTLRQ